MDCSRMCCCFIQYTYINKKIYEMMMDKMEKFIHMFSHPRLKCHTNNDHQFFLSTTTTTTTTKATTTEATKKIRLLYHHSIVDLLID